MPCRALIKHGTSLTAASGRRARKTLVCTTARVRNSQDLWIGGGPGNPLSDEELARKFRDNAVTA